MLRSGTQRLRMLAVEAMAVASQMADADCRRIMLDLAATYELLAEHAEAHALPSLPVEAEHRMPLPSDRAEHWQQRAERAHAMAEQITDPTAREMMLGVADSYEDLAKLN
jgi:hypothetical protein